MIAREFLRAFALAVLFVPAVARAQSIVGTLTRGNWQPISLALYEPANRLFVFDDTSNALVVFSTETRSEIATIPLPFDEVQSIVIDQSRGKVYAGCFCPRAGPANFVAVIDAVSLQILRYLSTSGYTLLSGDETRDRVYASYNGGVSAIDVATDSISPIAGITGGNLYTSIDVNPVTHEIFVGNWSQNDDVLYVVNPTTLNVEKIPNFVGLGIRVNWIENKAYIAFCKAAEFNGFCVYDRDTGAVTSLVTDNDSTRLIFNPSTNRMHSTSEINRRSTIIDGGTNNWFNVNVGIGGNGALGVRTLTGRVYYVLLDETVVMAGASAEITARLPAGVATGGVVSQDIVIDQTRGLVYVINDGRYGKVTIINDNRPTRRRAARPAARR